MHIFRGKLDFFGYAENEAITLIVPKSFQTGEPVYVSWKWTKIPSACSDPHFFDVGTFAVESINGKAKTKISFLHSHYHFEAIFGHDFKSLVLIAKLIDGKVQDPIVLSLVYNAGDLSTPRFFIGSFGCPNSKSELALGNQVSAVDEMFLLVAPHGFTHYQPVLALSQLTIDDHDKRTAKTNLDCHDQIQSVDEMLKFTFRHGGDYFFEGGLSRDGKQVTATMKSSKHEWFSNFVLEEIQPAARLLVFANTETTVVNDSDELVHCTLVQAGNERWEDVAMNWASMGLASLGVPALPLALKVVAKIKTVVAATKIINRMGYVSTAGGAITASMSFKDMWESDSTVVSETLSPGCSMKRVAIDNGNILKVIRTYVASAIPAVPATDDTPAVDAVPASIKVDSIDKTYTSTSTVNVSNLLNDTAATKNLLTFATPSTKYEKIDTSIIQFSGITPALTQSPLDSPPKHLKPNEVLTVEMSETSPPSEITTSHGLLTKIISDGPTGASGSVITRKPGCIMHYGTFSESGPNPRVTLLSLSDGRPVLKLVGCIVAEPPGGANEISYQFLGTADDVAGNDGEALKVIKKYSLTQNPDTYYWAYSIFTKDNVKRVVSTLDHNSFLRRQAGAISYIVARPGITIFREMKEV